MKRLEKAESVPNRRLFGRCVAIFSVLLSIYLILSVAFLIGKHQILIQRQKDYIEQQEQEIFRFISQERLLDQQGRALQDIITDFLEQYGAGLPGDSYHHLISSVALSSDTTICFRSGPALSFSQVTEKGEQSWSTNPVPFRPITSLWPYLSRSAVDQNLFDYESYQWQEPNGEYSTFFCRAEGFINPDQTFVPQKLELTPAILQEKETIVLQVDIPMPEGAIPYTLENGLCEVLFKTQYVPSFAYSLDTRIQKRLALRGAAAYQACDQAAAAFSLCEDDQTQPDTVFLRDWNFQWKDGSAYRLTVAYQPVFLWEQAIYDSIVPLGTVLGAFLLLGVALCVTVGYRRKKGRETAPSNSPKTRKSRRVGNGIRKKDEKEAEASVRRGIRRIVLRIISALFACYLIACVILTITQKRGLASETSQQIEAIQKTFYQSHFNQLNDLVQQGASDWEVVQAFEAAIFQLAKHDMLPVSKNISWSAMLFDASGERIAYRGETVMRLTINKNQTGEGIAEKTIEIPLLLHISWEDFQSFRGLFKPYLERRDIDYSITGYWNGPLFFPLVLEAHPMGMTEQEGLSQRKHWYFVTPNSDDIVPITYHHVNVAMDNAPDSLVFSEKDGFFSEKRMKKYREKNNQCDVLLLDALERERPQPGANRPSAFLLIQRLEGEGGSYYVGLSMEPAFLWIDSIEALGSLYLILFLFIAAIGVLLSILLIHTDQKRRKLEENRRLLNNAMAHELKTPLAVIRSYGELIQENIAQEKRAYYLNVIQSEIDTADQMIRDMLELSKLEAEARTNSLCWENVSLTESCRKAMDAYRALLDARHIAFSETYQSEGKVCGDAARLEKVITNFLSNAIKFTGDAGEIRVSVTEEGGLIRVSVWNRGDPIPEADFSHLWDAFYKGSTSGGEKKDGTGLGLAIAEQILALHHAQYGCANRDDGVLFWFAMRMI